MSSVVVDGRMTQRVRAIGPAAGLSVSHSGDLADSRLRAFDSVRRSARAKRPATAMTVASAAPPRKQCKPSHRGAAVLSAAPQAGPRGSVDQPVMHGVALSPVLGDVNGRDTGRVVRTCTCGW